MARIDLSDPYERYLKSQVDAGLFRSITAAAEHAILNQMKEEEKLRLSGIQTALAKGEEDISNGRTFSYSPGLISEISKKGKEAALSGKSLKREVKG